MASDESTWNRLKSFARGVANAFLLNDDSTRVGLITYSTEPKLELQFDEKNDQDEFSDFLNTVTSAHGTPNLERALALANNKLFVPSAGMRTKVNVRNITSFSSQVYAIKMKIIEKYLTMCTANRRVERCQFHLLVAITWMTRYENQLATDLSSTS